MLYQQLVIPLSQITGSPSEKEEPYVKVGTILPE